MRAPKFTNIDSYLLPLLLPCSKAAVLGITTLREIFEETDSFSFVVVDIVVTDAACPWQVYIINGRWKRVKYEIIDDVT